MSFVTRRQTAEEFSALCARFRANPGAFDDTRDQVLAEWASDPALDQKQKDFCRAARARWAVVRDLVDAAAAEGDTPRDITLSRPVADQDVAHAMGEFVVDKFAIDAVTWQGALAPEKQQLASRMARLLEYYAGAPVEAEAIMGRAAQNERRVRVVYAVRRGACPLDEAERAARADEWRAVRAVLEGYFQQLCDPSAPGSPPRIPTALCSAVCARVSELAIAIVTQCSYASRTHFRAELSFAFEPQPASALCTLDYTLTLRPNTQA